MSKSLTTASINSFDKHPRRMQELAGRTIADDIYRQVLGATAQVSRYDPQDGERHLLDREHAIDSRITFSNGMILTLQEKFLSFKYAKYESMTIEYQQDQFSGEPGDWYKIASQLYFVGYLSGDNSSFVKWVLVDFCRLVLATQNGKVNWRMNANKDGHARASFKWIPFGAIPADCIIAKS